MFWFFISNFVSVVTAVVAVVVAVVVVVFSPPLKLGATRPG